jgi:CBS domain-containing protein
MPTVREVLMSKGAKVYSTSPDTTVLDAVGHMNDHKIGALVVMDGEEVVGMFTERDVLRRVVGQERSASATKVGEVMTSEVVCCQPSADLDDVAAIMKNRRVRHVPVCDGNGQLVGMVSMGDVNAHNASNQQSTIHFLNEYIYGRA